MTSGHRWELEEEATALAREGDFGSAGDTFVKASFEEAGDWFGSNSWAMELRILFKACLCYRLAKQSRQCEFAAWLGIDLAEEYAERAEAPPTPSHPPDRAQRGAWHEFVGDFRLIAGLDGVTDAYEQAKDRYEQAGNPTAHYAEGPIMSSQATFSTVVLVADVDYNYIRESTQGQLTDWVEYKQEYIGQFIDQIIASGEWKLPEK
ncbi:hypothetical protein [Haloferax sp. DFSO60]|uniref:hypothetical protein n=1 Tax=Haloferax sp. DFSO60 TaxID=3388652 RepID=UPI0039780B05